MPEKTNNGGPAFPVHDPNWMEPTTSDDAMRAACGMSLRDYFAAKAMAAYLSHPQGALSPTAALSRDAYAMADAMLAARESAE